MPNDPPSDAKKWFSGFSDKIVAPVIVILLGAVLTYFFSSFFTGDVKVFTYKDSTDSGRCVDREIVISNESINTDIVLSFKVDYFTKLGAVKIVYGDEIASMLTSVTKTKIKRKPYTRIIYNLDNENNQITIPALHPSEYIHFYYSGDTIVDFVRAKIRNKLIDDKAPSVVNTPILIKATRKNGIILMSTTDHCIK